MRVRLFIWSSFVLIFKHTCKVYKVRHTDFADISKEIHIGPHRS